MTPASNRGPGRPARQRTGSVRRNAARPGSSAAAAPPQSAKFTGRAVILAAVILLLVASYTSSLHAWWEQRGEIQSTKAQITMYNDAIKQLQDDKRRWSDKAFIEQQARERFGWVLPGEVGYRVIGSDGQVQGNVPTLDRPPAPQPTMWYDKLWGTVVESGQLPKKQAAPDPDKVLKKSK